MILYFHFHISYDPKFKNSPKKWKNIGQKECQKWEKVLDVEGLSIFHLQILWSYKFPSCDDKLKSKDNKYFVLPYSILLECNIIIHSNCYIANTEHESEQGTLLSYYF